MSKGWRYQIFLITPNATMLLTGNFATIMK